MTDERLGGALIPAIAALPRGAGIIFRHYALPVPDRHALFERVKRIARRRRLTLVLAGPPRLARRWGADGFHSLQPSSGRRHSLLHTASAHDLAELIRAQHNGADLVFLSPVHPTRSHPTGKPLGHQRFGAIARRSPLPVIALGGMDARRARITDALGAWGWAAIDGLTPRRLRT